MNTQKGISKYISIYKEDIYTVFSLFGLKIKIKRNKYLIKKLKEDIFILESRLACLPYEIKGTDFLDKIKIPKLKSTDETISELHSSRAAIARFGDGEFKIIFQKEDVGFQSVTPLLAQRLLEVLTSNNKNVFIAITNIFGNMDHVWETGLTYSRNFLNNYRAAIYEHLDFERVYYDANFTRLYMRNKDKLKKQTRDKIASQFENIKKIWQGRDVVIVEGVYTAFGVGNDLLAQAKSVKRIICPPENAFDKYNEILAQCMAQSKGSVFILSLGPTATVLAYELGAAGYQALDIGHLDIEYEWFLSATYLKYIVPNKYTNELDGGNKVKRTAEPQYYKEIVAEIE